MSDLLLYGAIGWDVSAIDTVRAIQSAKGKAQNVRVNSPGGYVWEGLAIANAVRAHGNVTTHVDALAASMGSVIFVSGKRRVMSEGSRLMIHNPTSMAGGESEDLRKEADVLDGIAADMARMYADASGGKLSIEDAAALMDAETWFSPEEAVAAGLAHAIEGKAVAFAKIPETMKYRNQPKEIAAMSETDTTPKPSLLDSVLAKIGLGSDSIRAELTEAQGALAEAASRLVLAEARVTDAEAKVVALESAHAIALAAAVAESKIIGAQEFAAAALKANAPQGLPHVETVDPVGETHSAKWESLRASGDFKAAGEYYRQNGQLILEGK